MPQQPKQCTARHRYHSLLLFFPAIHPSLPMDPVSITCAVVTLATALKDLIELGITLKEFCERVTNNNEELVRLAAQIPTDLEELERLYLQNPNHMEQKSELKEAIGKLTQKVQMIYAKVQNLKLNHSKHGIISWTKIKAPFKAPDVEREIRSLKEDISNCHQSFQTFAAIRIEAGVDEVLATSQQMQADMAEIKLQLVSFTREQRFEITHMKSCVLSHHSGALAIMHCRLHWI
ncbi:hypothetical protein CPB83DRAFT_88131 [Crepidotus variabilis]|uniref:Uncharacterized protein n=1 Tax=Crepidotus variabilis TaxID=179855 RepID=A0A9P6EME9_9AGAR|nr:hypothetical protein CPB83DRAFT_88131 [Crepidotus variabilis]